MHLDDAPSMTHCLVRVEDPKPLSQNIADAEIKLHSVYLYSYPRQTESSTRTSRILRARTRRPCFRTKACTSGLRWRWPVLGQRCTPPPTRRRWTLGWRIWSTASAARYVASAWVPEVSKECAGQLFFAIFRQKCTRIYYRLLPRLYLVNRLWPFQCGSRKSHVRTARKGIENSNQDVSRYIYYNSFVTPHFDDTFCTHILFAPPLPALQSEPLPTAWTSCTSTVGGFFLFLGVFCRCLTTKPHLSSLNQRSCWSLLSWRKL